MTNAVARLRDYLAARDLDTEVAGGLTVQKRDVEHLSAAPMTLERIPTPLPPGLLSVARLLLLVFGVLAGAGALYVLGGAAAVVLMPLLMGREGVGTAMITLFTVCLTFVISGILLLAARSAARVIRRERRGVRSLYAFAVAGCVATLFLIAFSQWISVAFFAPGDGEATSFNWTVVARGAEVCFLVLFVWAALRLRPYARASNAADRPS